MARVSYAGNTGRVVALLERNKVEDSQEYNLSLLKAEKAAGKLI